MSELFLFTKIHPIKKRSLTKVTSHDILIVRAKAGSCPCDGVLILLVLENIDRLQGPQIDAMYFPIFRAGDKHRPVWRNVHTIALLIVSSILIQLASGFEGPNAHFGVQMRRYDSGPVAREGDVIARRFAVDGVYTDAAIGIPQANGAVLTTANNVLRPIGEHC